MRGTLLWLAGCVEVAAPVRPTPPSTYMTPTPTPPVLVPPGAPSRVTSLVTQLAAGADATCALHADGTVDCWGDDSFDVVATADGAKTDRGVMRPTRITELPPATRVVLGYDHGCALSGARVWCWGTDDGALGVGGSLPPGPPPSTKPKPVLGLTDVEALAGRRHLCARVAGGTVSCWHDYDSGSGDPRDAGSTQPVVVPGFRGATQLTDGGSLSCALLGSGQARCFRDVSPGRIPRGQVRVGAVPVPGLGPVTALFAGQYGVCGITAARTVRCWGQPALPRPSGASYHSSAYAVAGLTDVTQLALGDDLGCALVAGGAVLCGEDGEALSPVALPQTLEIVAGAAHACARTATGQVLCWGRNEHGQLGAGDTKPHAVPVVVGF